MDSTLPGTLPPPGYTARARPLPHTAVPHAVRPRYRANTSSYKMSR